MTSSASPGREPGLCAGHLRGSTAMRMHYNDGVFKAVRDSDWSANHAAAHGVTLDEVRAAILEPPYSAAPGPDPPTMPRLAAPPWTECERRFSSIPPGPSRAGMARS